MRVLLIAEQANPEWVSVPLVGWSMCHAISQVTSALIVTHVRNREAFLRFGLRENIDFVVLDTEAVARPLYLLGKVLRGGDGKGWTTVTALQGLAYYAFEAAVWRQLGQRIRNKEFALVHRVTPLSPTSPSTLAKKCHRANVPFVLGPLNGGLPWPAGFESRRRAEREWLSYVRGIYKLMPGYGATRKYASAIIVGSRATQAQMPQRYGRKLFYMPENGIDPNRFHKQRSRKAELPLTAIFVGRLVPYKCPDVLIRAALPLLKRGELRLRVVGDGPLRAELEALVRAASVQHAVEFLGWLAHEDVQSALVEADVMALPSVREFGGGVVLESMACGVPAIVADYGGPAELISADSGIKVSFADEQSLEANLRLALQHLVQHPSQLDVWSKNALAESRAKFSWQAKATGILEIYRRVIEAENPKPSVD